MPPVSGANFFKKRLTDKIFDTITTQTKTTHKGDFV